MAALSRPTANEAGFQSSNLRDVSRPAKRVIPTAIEAQRWIPVTSSVFPTRPKMIPSELYVSIRPALYARRSAINRRLQRPGEGKATASGPHMPAQCKLPASPRMNAVQISICYAAGLGITTARSR